MEPSSADLILSRKSCEGCGEQIGSLPHRCDYCNLLGQANTGLFIVYNDTRGLNDTIPAGGGRSLILKFSRMFDLID